MTTTTSINGRLLASVPPGAWATVTATETGVLAGTLEALDQLPPQLADLVSFELPDGAPLRAGTVIARATGSGIELNGIEDHLLGVLGFASGIATRAQSIAAAAPAGLRIVCGAWKKLPAGVKPAVRAGLDAAGIGHRLLAEEFVYIDKNGVLLLGGVPAAVRAGQAVGNGPVAVQLKDPADVVDAVRAGAGAVMVDTGNLADLRRAADLLAEAGCHEVVLAFGGAVGPDDLVAARAAGASVVDIGRAILDAPLLDLRLDVRPSSVASQIG